MCLPSGSWGCCRVHMCRWQTQRALHFTKTEIHKVWFWVEWSRAFFRLRCCCCCEGPGVALMPATPAGEGRRGCSCFDLALAERSEWEDSSTPGLEITETGVGFRRSVLRHFLYIQQVSSLASLSLSSYCQCRWARTWCECAIISIIHVYLIVLCTCILDMATWNT